jgi:hypothetical protein
MDFPWVQPASRENGSFILFIALSKPWFAIISQDGTIQGDNILFHAMLTAVTHPPEIG